MRNIKTWREISFKDIFSERKKNRIIGLTFPKSDPNLGLEPSILTVLPQGKNVEYCIDNRLFNDDDVELYMCSVYISGYDDFVEWALKHDRNKIIVGGYHPTTFPEEFERYATKIVQGPCDDIYATLAQKGNTVRGIVSNRNLPRRDIYDIRMNQQIILDKKPKDVVASINTSMGCNVKPPCDFCCTPMMCNKIIQKPLNFVEKEARSLRIFNPKFLFIRDENFTMQADWKDRLSTIHKSLPSTKIYLFASANMLNCEKINYMYDCGVYMICLGLEDPTVEYSKNERLDKVVNWLKNSGISAYLSFIVNPMKIIGREAGENFYGILMKRVEELAPEMICGNFLMPFRGTKIWDEYYAHISPEDYKYYDSKTPFLVHNPIVREKMKFFLFWYQWLYYTSDFYNQKVRKFECNDTLHLRFLELYQKFRIQYERLWNVRP